MELQPHWCSALTPSQSYSHHTAATLEMHSEEKPHMATATLMPHFTCSQGYSHHTATLKMHSGKKPHMDATLMKSLSCRFHDQEKLNKEGGNCNKDVKGHGYAQTNMFKIMT